MDRFEEHSQEMLDFKFSKNNEEVRVGINVFGVDDDKKNKLFNATKEYKEIIKKIFLDGE